MPAFEALSPQLFHGSRAVIKGRVISTPWSTDNPEAAREYGKTKLPDGETGPLKVYKVQPFHMPDVTSNPHPYMQGVTNYASPMGYMITGEHKFDDE
jgi:hypothetical protein